ncbi:hypothetical protein HUU61_18855 [Rhodopseudomonas palustris]|uniref:Uncharacterized protein n=1 Tax=Rhodopseudomonas palustris (strain BisB5) TaxID=316057 RepID=Q138J2_RHOPS|nr:hypothetical protein RPD_2262 [Rhodopseudomonas palustris BisB5]MBB1093337.1 hypothetical protein [Rhodopseudomonas palustris]
MTLALRLPPQLASDLERKYFWWEPIGAVPRSEARLLAQAMSFATFAEGLELERNLGSDALADAMLSAEPGWIDPRSWEFWRGRLQRATGRALPETPPERAFDAEDL